MTAQLDFDGVERAAVFSSCRMYRYSLTRVWDADLPPFAFVGLNPSTADEFTDDRTVRRCMDFAARWGFGQLVMLNAYGLRSTDPRELKKVEDPVGPRNDQWLASEASRVEKLRPREWTMPNIVVSWGAHCSPQRERQALLALGVAVACLGQTKDGRPLHPLYLKKTTERRYFQLRTRA